MFWRKKEPKYTLAEFNAFYAMLADKVTVMNVEARKANMVETGLLPQEHLSRADMLANRARLQHEGHAGMGRRHSAEAGTPDDPDLTARDDD